VHGKLQYPITTCIMQTCDGPDRPLNVEIYRSYETFACGLHALVTMAAGLVLCVDLPRE